jgi:hypothetical protein
VERYDKAGFYEGLETIFEDWNLPDPIALYDQHF